MAIKKLELEEARLPFPEDEVLTLRIEAKGEAKQTLINLLGAIQWACMAGHSGTFGAFFDGDGADFVRIKGLPKGDYSDMAQATSYHGGTYELFGPHSAFSVTQTQDTKSTRVWPPEEKASAEVCSNCGCKLDSKGVCHSTSCEDSPDYNALTQI